MNNDNNIGTFIKEGYKLLRDSISNSQTSSEFKLPKSRKKYHLHFGAGNLGVGLVMPKFIDETIIIQRPSNGWQNLSDISEIRLSVNDVEYFTIPFLFQGKHDFNESFNTLYLKGGAFLICTDNETILDFIVKNAKSVSTSVGIDGLAITKKQLESFYRTKNTLDIYPFENDYSCLKSLSKTKFNVIPIVADKICSNKIISETGIDVKAEKYEQIYLFADHSRFKKIFHLDSFMILDDEKVFEFYSRRKLYIVNGLHMVSAILGYAYYNRRNLPIAEWGTRHLTEVLGHDNIKSQVLKFLDIQILRLIIETTPEILYKALSTNNIQESYIALKAFGEDIIDNRFDLSLDNLSRLLDLDKNKLLASWTKIDQRINKIVQFIDTKKVEVTELLSELKLIKSSREDLLVAIIKLQSDITSLQPQITKYLLNV